ncbi:hypothetical protein G9464_02625 [Halostella sp. JP-L12]|uniref:LVIVD repeat-containing protein n=1 Tax=Halostella TaxID=1843185 RepID=UPI000EF7FD03|nr:MULTISPECIES: hypothetical protein [Halostella]NHN46494.1 hypothetical protein [Halostella sp. JP-L12]
MTYSTRRTFLRSIGAVTMAGGFATTGSAGQSQDLRLFGTKQVHSACTEAVTQGHYAYVTDYSPGNVSVIDLRNPNRLQEVASRDVPGSFAWDVKVEGNRMYVASQLDESGELAPPLGEGNPDEVGVTIYDISDPTDPTDIGFVPVPPVGSHNVYPDGTTLYVIRHAVPTDEGFQYVLEVWDVDDASDPSRIATYDPTDESTGLVHDVYVQNDLAYVAAFDAGLRILDVSDPASPEEVGHWPDPTDAAHYAQPMPNDDIVFVGDETFSEPYGGIHVLDTSDLSNIEKIGFIDSPDTPGFDTSHNFDVTANRLHTSWYEGGVRVFDISDPGSPSEIASYDPDGSSFWTAIQHRSFTLASDLSRGSIALLHTDRGERAPPAGDATPIDIQGDGVAHTARRHPGPDE